MESHPEARPRAKSPFVAAVLSLLFPGLGHAYAGAPQRALAFAAAPVLLLALLAGVVLRMDPLQLGGYLLVPWVPPAIFALNLAALAYRLLATVDAWRVTTFLNAWEAGGGGRYGRPHVPITALSVAGLLAVLLVLAGAHVAVARYDLVLMTTADCVFDPDRVCGPTPSPGSSATVEPGETDEPEPTISLPPEGSAVPNETVPPWNGRERLNILLIGADEQEGGHNTDTLIVVSIDPVSRQVAMFSLPRDTVDVPVPAGNARRLFGSVYRGKVNSWFINIRGRRDLFPGTERTRGYNGLKALLGELYQIDIKYYVEVNFDGFIKVVDALGGVTVNVQVPVVDEQYPGERGTLRRVYIPSGIQHMSGAQALVYARSRKGKYGIGSNDYDRGQRQQRLLLSLRQQTDIATIVPRIDALAAAVGSAVRTDIPRELMPKILGLAGEVDTRRIRSYVFAPPRYGREGTRSGFVIFPNVSRIRQSVQEAFVVDPALEARREALAAEGAEVRVLNGAGNASQAADLAAYLEYLGVTASAPSQRPDQAGGSATRVIAYNGAETAMPETAALLAELFGQTIRSVADPAVTADFIVITGGQTPTLTPPPAP